MLNIKTPAAKYIFYKWFVNQTSNVFVSLELEKLRKINKWDMKTIAVLDRTAEKSFTLTQLVEDQALYNVLFWFYAGTERPQKGNVYNALYARKEAFTPVYVKNAEGSLKLLEMVLATLSLESSGDELNSLKHLLSALSLSDLLLK